MSLSLGFGQPVVDTAIAPANQLVAKGVPGERSFSLPDEAEQQRLELTGKFLRLKESTSGLLQENDPRSFVGNIKFADKMQFLLAREVNSCSPEGDAYKHKYQGRETSLYSFQDAEGKTGFMIKHGRNAVVLTGATTREEARDVLEATFLPNYIGSPAWIKEGQGREGVFYSRLRSVEDAVSRASFPVRQPFVREGFCGGGC